MGALKNNGAISASYLRYFRMKEIVGLYSSHSRSLGYKE
jgi:hypothetical protein